MSGRLDQKRLRIVLYEGRGSRPLDEEQRRATLRGLLDDGHAVTRVAASGAVASADDAEHLVLGRFGDDGREAERFARSGLPVVDVTGRSADEVRTAVTDAVRAAGADTPGGWKPWFPVIDYDRCTNCLQCMTFCLFDVYGVDTKDTIAVQTADNCKTDCPACSRVCPEAAIVFPKYKSGPINGDVVRAEDLNREAMKVDISALLGGDIYAALRTRSADARERFSTERDESKALLERKRCLKKLGKALDIPDEVLMTLPSAGDIEERARRAREKAAKRAERSQTVKDRRPPTDDEWGI